MGPLRLRLDCSRPHTDRWLDRPCRTSARADCPRRWPWPHRSSSGSRCSWWSSWCPVASGRTSGTVHRHTWGSGLPLSALPARTASYAWCRKSRSWAGCMTCRSGLHCASSVSSPSSSRSSVPASRTASRADWERAGSAKKKKKNSGDFVRFGMCVFVKNE